MLQNISILNKCSFFEFLINQKKTTDFNW